MPVSSANSTNNQYPSSQTGQATETPSTNDLNKLRNALFGDKNNADTAKQFDSSNLVNHSSSKQPVDFKTFLASARNGEELQNMLAKVDNKTSAMVNDHISDATASLIRDYEKILGGPMDPALRQILTNGLGQNTNPISEEQKSKEAFEAAFGKKDAPTPHSSSAGPRTQGGRPFAPHQNASSPKPQTEFHAAENPVPQQTYIAEQHVSVSAHSTQITANAQMAAKTTQTSVKATLQQENIKLIVQSKEVLLKPTVEGKFILKPEAPLSKEMKAEITQFLAEKGFEIKWLKDGTAVVQKKQDGIKNQATNQKLPSANDKADPKGNAAAKDKAAQEGEAVAESVDWPGFFSALSLAGAKTKEQKIPLADVLACNFRGHDGEAVIVDLLHKMTGELKKEEFAKIALKDPALAEFLKNLKPGDPLPQAMLEKLFGSELSAKLQEFVLQKEPALAETLKKIREQFQDPNCLKKPVDLEKQAYLEHTIFSRSRGKDLASDADAAFTQATVIANAQVLQKQLRQNFLGKMKWYSAIGYTLMVFGLVMTLILLLRK